MCNLVGLIEKHLGKRGDSAIERERILEMAGGCYGLRMLIFLAYRDDAGEILREIREELEKLLE